MLFIITFLFLQILNSSASELASNINVYQHDLPQNSETFILYEGDENDAIADLRKYLTGLKAGEIQFKHREFSNGQNFGTEKKGNTTTIYHSGGNSLSNAIYWLLNKYGFSWYNPTEAWEIKPGSILFQEWAYFEFEPTFIDREYFGTGGINFSLSFDKGKTFNANVENWNRRNNWSQDIKAPGHTGEAFYAANKTLLEAHPEWFANKSGMKAGRFKIEIPEALKAYKDWTKRRYEGLIKSDPKAIIISAEPGDGRGGKDDPLPPDGFMGIKDWNHADKWCYVVNEVAKDYLNDTRVTIGYLAYGNGATNVLPPKFKLLPNIRVSLIPYAFQRAYSSDLDMFEAWKGTGAEFLVRDYWNITQWSKGMPQQNIFLNDEKIKRWKGYGFTSVHIESTWAWGPTGHMLWLASKQFFYPDANFDSLYNKYLNDCFHEAAPIMKRIYDRWSLKYQGSGEWIKTSQDLEEAMAATTNEKVKLRIIDLMAYANYMKLYSEHDNTDNSKRVIMNYMYSIHNRMMIQTAAFPIRDYIKPSWRGQKNTTWSITFLSDNEVEKLQKRNARATSSYEFYEEFDPTRAQFLETPSSWLYGRNVTTWFYGRGNPVKIEVGSTTKSTVAITSDDFVLNKIVGNGASKTKIPGKNRVYYSSDITIPGLQNVRYSMKIGGVFSRLTTQDKMIFWVAGGSEFDNYQYPPHYFYIPSQANEVIFDDPLGKGYLISPDGKKLSGNRVSGSVYRFEIPKENRGKVWACQFFYTKWKILNLPNIFSIQKFKYNPS